MKAKRIIIYFIGVLLMVLGFIMNAKSGLGTTPICSIAYCVAYITGLSFPDMTMVLFMLCFFAGLFLTGTKPHWTDFLQLPYCFVFTRCMSAFAAVLPSPEHIAVKIIFQAFGIICVGSGASLTLNMHIIPNPGDFMVNAAAYRMHKPLGFAKNVVDISIVLSAVILALIFHKNILQAGVGIGTIAAMFLVGRVMALISMLLSDKLRYIYKNAHIGWLDDRPETIEVAK